MYSLSAPGLPRKRPYPLFVFDAILWGPLWVCPRPGHLALALPAQPDSVAVDRDFLPTTPPILSSRILRPFVPHILLQCKKQQHAVVAGPCASSVDTVLAYPGDRTLIYIEWLGLPPSFYEGLPHGHRKGDPTMQLPHDAT